ncbi:MAG TPA: hypothetical protein VKK31_18795 [Thermoanaerobaculia bacterium]|nr:hypothetical protein [Thermoanaerobaculia bacterium]
MPSPYSRSRRCITLAASALLLTLPLAAMAETKPKPAKQQEEEQKEGYLRSLPYPKGPLEESDLIKMHSARMLYLLTYPTGVLPSEPWDKAKTHVKRYVADAEPWPGEALAPPRKGRQKAVVAPGTNTWVAYGPKPLDSVGTTNNAYQYGIVSGRVSAGGLAVNPSNPSVAYAGFVAGGLWKTTNLGAAAVTWTPLWDDKDFVTQSAGAIEIDPTNNNVVYAGTGDFDANDQFSAGIMKTADAGASWTQLGADVFTPYSPALPAGGNRWPNQNVRVIEVDPNNANNILVGTRYDLYISHDAGSSWQICPFGNNYTNPSVSNPTFTAINRIGGIYLDGRGGSTVAYVAVGYYANNGNGNNGVYRFNVPASGCPAWPGGFTTLFGGFPAGTGNGVNNASGGSLTGRIEIAAGMGADAKLTLYAQVSKASDQSAEGTYVLRPDGGSTAWTKLTGSTTFPTCSSGSSGTGQDWYDLFIAVDPANDKTLYTGHIDVFKSTVNATYTSMTSSNLTNVYTTSCPSYGKVHPDQHTLTFVPGTSGSTFLLGNDGGVYYNNNRGDVAAWKQLNDTINTNQFYAGQIGKDFAGGGAQWWFGGMQDNGIASWDSTKTNLTATGRSVGGDGFFSVFDPLAGTETAGWWFTEYTNGSVYCSKNGGANGPFASGCGPAMTGTADWSAPLQMDTLHCTNSICRNLLFAEDYVWMAGTFTATKPTWRKVSGLLTRGGSADSIIAVNLAPSEPKSAVAGTSDGKVWWSENTYTGASCTQAAANTASFSCSPNTSATWRDVDSTNAVLPNRAILGVAHDPTSNRTVYAAVGGFDDNTPATPGHLFQFIWNGTAWTRANKTGNLPDVPAASVVVNPLNRKQVFVGTYFGFYFTDDIDAATPVWQRYQWGLPNTVIQYLTVDRGPAASPFAGTTLMAFTYGRGVYAIKLPTGGASFPTH